MEKFIWWILFFVYLWINAYRNIFFYIPIHLNIHTLSIIIIEICRDNYIILFYKKIMKPIIYLIYLMFSYMWKFVNNKQKKKHHDADKEFAYRNILETCSFGLSKGIFSSVFLGHRLLFDFSYKNNDIFSNRS